MGGEGGQGCGRTRPGKAPGTDAQGAGWHQEGRAEGTRLRDQKLNTGPEFPDTLGLKAFVDFHLGTRIGEPRQ